MRSQEELVGELARHPRGVAEYAFELQEQLRQLAGDVQEQAQRSAPLSREVLEPEVLPEEEPRPPRPRRRLRPAVRLEVRREVLEPADKTCMGNARAAAARAGWSSRRCRPAWCPRANWGWA